MIGWLEKVMVDKFGYLRLFVFWVLDENNEKDIELYFKDNLWIFLFIGVFEESVDCFVD